VHDNPGGRDCYWRPAGVGFRARSQSCLIMRTLRAMSRGIWGYSRFVRGLRGVRILQDFAGVFRGRGAI
jgi:hypothetical protein